MSGVIAALTASVVALLPLGPWWQDTAVSGISVAAMAIPVTATGGVIFGARHAGAAPAKVLQTSLMMAVFVVLSGALCLGLVGSLEILGGTEDVPVLAPFGAVLLGLFILGPVVVLVALPASLAWAVLGRFLVRGTARQAGDSG